VRDDADWGALAAELGRAEWRGLGLDARRARQAEIDAALAEWTQTLAAPEAEKRLQRAGVPAHAVLNGELSREDAQLAHRGHFVETQHALLGTVFVESTGYRFERAVPVVGKVPSLGGDSERVRALLPRPR
jgi:crotonobetainyl-CoA:carnitine CoA-transferase CaiB-like acyl-CoA transferase